MNMKGQQKKEKGKVYIYSIRRERIIDEIEMLQNGSTKQINKEWRNERGRRWRKKMWRGRQKRGQKKDIEGASRRKALIFHEKENLKFKKI
jgi:hypothetical protein